MEKHLLSGFKEYIYFHNVKSCMEQIFIFILQKHKRFHRYF